MYISSVNQWTATNAAPPVSSDSVSLSARVAAMQVNSVEDPSEVPPADGPSIDPVTDFDLEEIYQWLLANSQSMTDDPKMMIDGVISKLKKLTRSDGTFVYKNYSQMTVACAALQKRCADNGVESGQFFDKLNGTVFGMNMFISRFMSDIFFSDDSNNYFPS